MFGLFKKKNKKAPKLSLDDVDLQLDRIPGAVEIIDGFPRIQWPIVGQAVNPYSQHPALDQIWIELAAQWLGLLRRHLGEHYRIYESNQILLLSPQSPDAANDLLKLGDTAFERLERLLQRKSQELGWGKHVVLFFESEVIFYDYIAYFYPDIDRAYGAMGGIHISHGYYHTAINGFTSGTSRILVHELAHNMVVDRPLPRWLNEGLAQFVEDMVPAYRSPIINSQQARLQHRYWSWFGMDHFWNGQAFQQASSQRLSYQLADILFRNLVHHYGCGTRLQTFLATAHRDDAGQSACQQCFDRSLSQLVEEFLGPGMWNPQLTAHEDGTEKNENVGQSK